MAMGSDQSVSSLPGYALRSSTSISEYIGHVFDNTNWLTRLTSSGLTLKTPLSTNFQITSTLPTDCTVLDRVDNSGQQLDRLQSPEAAELRYYNQLFGYRDFKWAGRLRQGYVGGWNSNSDRHQSRIFQQH